MRVARHEMPGTCRPEARPGGYGMIRWPRGGYCSRCGPSVAPQITPVPTGRIMSGLYQGFHAWLPSFPSLRDKAQRAVPVLKGRVRPAPRGPSAIGFLQSGPDELSR